MDGWAGDWDQEMRKTLWLEAEEIAQKSPTDNRKEVRGSVCFHDHVQPVDVK
jgi:hypothetical protein